jgi:hypothetical protein
LFGIGRSNKFDDFFCLKRGDGLGALQLDCTDTDDEERESSSLTRTDLYGPGEHYLFLLRSVFGLFKVLLRRSCGSELSCLLVLRFKRSSFAYDCTVILIGLVFLTSSSGVLISELMLLGIEILRLQPDNASLKSDPALSEDDELSSFKMFVTTSSTY